VVRLKDKITIITGRAGDDIARKRRRPRRCDV